MISFDQRIESIMMAHAQLWQQPKLARIANAFYSAMPQTRKTKREIEIKLRVTDIRAAIYKLNAIRATSKGRVFEQNTLYDTPQSDLRQRGSLLRIRIETPAIRGKKLPSGPQRIVMTTKGPPDKPGRTRRKSRYKERAEREVAVTGLSARSSDAALRVLGFKPKFRYEKFRTSFRLGNLHLDLDETPAGNFLELEGQPQSIDHVASALGYAPSDYIRGTYWDVYAADCCRRGVKPKNMVFASIKSSKPHS